MLTSRAVPADVNVNVSWLSLVMESSLSEYLIELLNNSDYLKAKTKTCLQTKPTHGTCRSNADLVCSPTNGLTSSPPSDHCTQLILTILLKKKKKGFYQVFCSYKLNSVPRTFLSTDYTHIPSGWSPIDRFLPATAIKLTGMQFLNFCLPSLLQIIFYFFDWLWKLWPFPSASWSVTFVNLETTLNHLGLMDSRLPYHGSQTCLLSIYLCFCRDSSHWRSCKLEKFFLEPQPL